MRLLRAHEEEGEHRHDHGAERHEREDGALGDDGVDDGAEKRDERDEYGLDEIRLLLLVLADEDDDHVDDRLDIIEVIEVGGISNET